MTHIITFVLGAAAMFMVWWLKDKEDEAMSAKDNFKVGQHIIYVNGEHYELGRIKSLREDGAFVAYHSGETGAKTPYDLMHPLVNEFVIEKTMLGGGYFDYD